MKGYKAFDKNLRCLDMQYEIGQTYEMSGEIKPCEKGFHFCKSLADCYKFYPTTEDTRVCEVTALGDVKTDDGIKFCTNNIMIGKEIKKCREKSNTSLTNSGYCNNGRKNSGNWNIGNYNSGYCNSGNANSGYWNIGACNTGDCNSGDGNSGKHNKGNCNSGYCNIGNRNSGSYNIGSRNSGNYNSGDRNSGDWNSGNYNNGIFCTSKQPTIRIFDKDSNWTIVDWIFSHAKRIMDQCPCSHFDFIVKENMSDKEKDDHPEYKTFGGYNKMIIVTQEDKQKWWDELTDEKRQFVFDLPNFDAEKFKECTGITISKES